jgi:hypothetical protein
MTYDFCLLPSALRLLFPNPFELDAKTVTSIATDFGSHISDDFPDSRL